MTLARPGSPVAPPPSPASPPRRGRGRRILLVGLAVLAVLVLLTGVALVVAVRLADRPATVPPDFTTPDALPAAATPVPVGAVVFDADPDGHFELYVDDRAGATGTTADASAATSEAGDGGGARALTGDARFDSWWPRLSPDRRTVLFYRTPAGTHDRDFTSTALWAVAADGGDPVLLRPAGLDGWVQQGHAEWAPDGRSLTMFGGSLTNPQVFVTDPLGRAPRAVTDRPGTNIDPSFSADGRTILFVGCPQAICTPGSYEIYRIGLTGGEAQRLTEDDLRDHDPYESPDGRQVAWLTQVEGGLVGTWDIRIAAADGSGARRLTGLDGVTSKPDWAPDGSVIAFHRLEPGTDAFALFTVRPDGTDLRPLDPPPADPTAGTPATNREYPDL